MMTTLLRRTFVVAAALTMGSSLAVAQRSQVVDPRMVPELKAEFDRAAKLRLDVEPLDTKARQGYLFQKPQKAIVEAVRDLADRMVKARDALKPDRGTAEIVAGAGALQYDIPASALRNLRQVQKSRSLAVPIGSLTELVARGVPTQKALAQVESMLKSNFADAQISALASAVTNDVAQGVAPTTALDLRSKGVLSLPQASLPGVAATAIKPPR